MHAEAPADAAVVPVPHALHVSLDMAPTAEDAVPGGHSVHEDDPAMDQLPAGHSTQVLLS